MALGKKIRFEVFKRDKFTCQYCGSTPPKVTLEVDHIKPKSKKGSDEINNLITACFDCNRGKSNIELNRMPRTLKINAELIEEKELQYKEYQKLLRRRNNRVKKEVNSINELYQYYFKDHYLKERFLLNSVKKFINELGLETTKEAAEYAFSKFGDCGGFYTGNDSEQAIKYFCGICWHKIRGDE